MHASHCRTHSPQGSAKRLQVLRISHDDRKRYRALGSPGGPCRFRRARFAPARSPPGVRGSVQEVKNLTSIVPRGSFFRTLTFSWFATSEWNCYSEIANASADYTASRTLLP